MYPKDQGCTQVEPAEPGFSGYKVMECPHPFSVARYSANPPDCSHEAWTRGGLGRGGPQKPCGWVNAYTDRTSRTVWYWEQSPESLQHELYHVQGRIHDDW